MSMATFKYQMVHRNFMKFSTKPSESKIECASYCLLVTDYHHCTTFKLTSSDNICHCGVLSLFVISSALLELMHVNTLCKRNGISGEEAHLPVRNILITHLSLFSALFGVNYGNPTPQQGLPVETFGIKGITQCTAVSNMPSTDIVGQNSFVLVEDVIYSFGGKVTWDFASNVVYRYDLNTDIWTQKSNLLNHRRSSRADRISENEILLTGKNFK